MAQIKQIRGKDYIFCDWRGKYVRLTPEEYVRQLFLHRMVDEYGYAASLIAVEKRIPSSEPGTDKRLRFDALVYNSAMQPQMIIEFKADTVDLTQRTLDQIAVYNRSLGVPYLVLHNGRQTVIAQVEEQSIIFLDQLPTWKQLSH